MFDWLFIHHSGAGHASYPGASPRCTQVLNYHLDSFFKATAGTLHPFHQQAIKINCHFRYCFINLFLPHFKDRLIKWEPIWPKRWNVKLYHVSHLYLVRRGRRNVLPCSGFNYWRLTFFLSISTRAIKWVSCIKISTERLAD